MYEIREEIDLFEISRYIHVLFDLELIIDYPYLI